MLASSYLSAAEQPAGGNGASQVNPADAASRPVISPMGKKRVRDNITILAGNIRDLQENLTASKKNLETIHQEMKDLDGLEQEHLQLKKKYEAYLEFAARELKKNQKSTEDLEKWEKGAEKATDDKGLKEKLETARLERADRARWKMDAQSKMNRVNELMKSLADNLRDIRSRRAPLQEQLTEWNGREKQYETMLSEMTQKKTDLEEYLKQ